MKLHRIEVTNINSLYGTHTIDLDADLQGAALFLIQGPTGAGKSTIMDAVSLALFGTTPRLSALRSERAVAEQVMSRGTGQAQAVVEFSKLEQGTRVRYRATWSVHRSRKQPDGNVQNTVRGIDRRSASGDWEIQVSDTRNKFYDPVFTAVLERFSLADFQRSMLLAQGQFDAMLHADPGDRASILERLTDTAVYKELGERAARMWGAWKGRIARLDATVQAISPADAQTLADAKARATEHTARLARLDGLTAALGAWRSWRQRTIELARDQTQAAEALAAVQSRAAAHTDDLAALAQHERCQPGFKALDAHTGLAQRHAALAEQLDQLDGALPALKQRVVDTGAAAKVARAAADAASVALDALRPPVQRAEAAQAALADAEREHEAAKGAVVDAEERVKSCTTDAEEAASEQKQAAAERDAAAAAVTLVEPDSGLVDALPELGRRASTIVDAAAAHAEATTRLAARRTALDDERAQLGLDRAAHDDHAAQVLGPLQARVTDTQAVWESLADGPDLPTARARVEELALRMGALERAAAAVVTRDQAQSDASARRQQASLRARERVELDDRLGPLRDGRATALTTRDAAAAVVAPLERIAELERQRTELSHGDPCPLCGSDAHPFVDDADHAARLGSVGAELDQARAAQIRAQHALDAADAALAAHDRAVAVADAAVARAETEASEYESRAQELARAAGELLEPLGLPADAAAPAVAAAHRDAETARRAAQERVGALESASEARTLAADALHQAQLAQAKAAAELDRRAGALHADERSLATRVDELAADADATAEQRRALGDALARWDIDASPPETGLPQARTRAAAVTAAREALRTAEHTAAQAKIRADATAKARETAARALGQAAEQRDKRGKTVTQATDALDNALATVLTEWEAAIALDPPGTRSLGPAPTPAARLQSQQARVQQLEQAAGDAASAAQAAALELTGTRARRDELDGQRTTLSVQLDAAHKALAQALADLGLVDAPALAAHRLPDAQAAAWTKLRAELREQRAACTSQVETTAARMKRHLDAPPPAVEPDVLSAELPDTPAPGAPLLSAEVDPDALTGLLDQLGQTHAQVAEALADARTTLEMAARDQEKLEQARAQLDTARTDARVWQTLHDLIGTGDGDAFKKFAQALNLGQLLRSANVHLARLNDRYRLEPQLDPESGLPTLEFVIADQWRPGQPRGLKTLSGGESFLVSLALALGLSDLRTSTMPVETLLLDEGFGTLDAKTLDTALAALQALQATGRQVGIISHVVGLQESIEARVLVEPLGEGRSRVRTELGAR